MDNRQNKTRINVDLFDFFKQPKTPRQKQYETVRAFIVDKMPAENIAMKFAYKVNTVYEIIKNAKSGKLDLFPEVTKGPKNKRTPLEVQEKIITLRKNSLSVTDITNLLLKENINISERTIERILYDSGFTKLKRRTNKELGVTNKNKIIPESSENLDFNKLEPFYIDTPIAGVYLFLPYIIDSGIIEIVNNCKLPESSVIGSEQACLSMLLLKLIGNQRLSQMDQYDKEPGLGIFSGLNLLPKSTYMSTYSCLTSEELLLQFQEQIIKKYFSKYSEIYHGDFINLDFHSIPHYGEDAEMEKIWCGSRNKTMKGANTIFAQDAASNAIIYTRADILRKEESKEIYKFIDYWKQVKGNLSETLVFDCKFTKYEVLDKLTSDGIKFITLRKKHKKLLEEIDNLSRDIWKKVELKIPKRKYTKLLVYQSEVKLTQSSNTFRQIAIKNHGRKQPTFIITNHKDLQLSTILEVYARRWRIENKISELVSFFNLNALSSPIMIRIHFDLLWTMIADTLYKLFANDLRRFENNQAPTIFRKFINYPGKVHFDGNRFMVKIRKRAHTPIVKSIDKLNKPFRVPWLNNMTVEIIWTP